jgi:hypothetical protein
VTVSQFTEVYKEYEIPVVLPLVSEIVVDEVEPAELFQVTEVVEGVIVVVPVPPPPPPPPWGVQVTLIVVVVPAIDEGEVAVRVMVAEADEQLGQ